MRVFAINAVPYGSTGKIMFSLSEMLLNKGDESLCAVGFSWHKSNRDDCCIVGNIFTKTFHMYMSRFLGNHGCYSGHVTKRLIREIKAFSPDVIHLHNIHGWYLNIPKLFEYLKESNIPVVWTLHDCWAFTGGCAHFTFCRCNKWIGGCGDCNNLNEYPISSKKDKTRKMWKIKKECFSHLGNLTIVTPSKWLAELVNQSYLNVYPLQVINNGIDIDVFKPRASSFRANYGISKEHHLVLGVAMGWNERKGLDVFVDLAQRLPNDYKIVLVGTDEKTDKQLPDNVISIHRTQNQYELSEIYSEAEVFVNPTREENYPTVNMEAIACGTPVLTFRTGGSPEIPDETCGAVVDCDDVDAIEKEIIRICTEKPYALEQCLEKAKCFDQNERFKEYLNLYEKLVYRGN